MTTDVAETEVTATPTEAQATPSDESTETASEVTGGLQTQATEAEGQNEAAAQGTEEDAGEFKLDDLDEWKAIAGDASKETEQQAETSLPGKALAEVEQQLKDKRANEYRSFMEDGETWFVQKSTASELGLTAEEARTAWRVIGQPMLNSLHANHDDYMARLDNETVKLALDEEDGKAYFGRQYADPIEAKKALVAIGEAKANKTWEEKVKADYVSKADVAKLKTAAEVAFRARLEKAGLINGASSGDAVQGETPSFASDDAKLLDPKTPIEDINRILARRNGQ